MTTLLYINRTKKTASLTKDGGSASLPEFTAGEAVKFALRFVAEDSEGKLYEDDPELYNLTAVVGRIDARPTSGTFALRFGEKDTTPLPFNVNATALQQAINALAGFKDVTARDERGGFVLRFPGAANAVPVDIAANALEPFSFLRQWSYELDGVWHTEFRLTQVQYETTTNWGRVLPPMPSVETIQDGGITPDGSYKWAEIQRFFLPQTFRGTYFLVRPETEGKTRLFLREDGPDEMAEELNRLYPEALGGIRVEQEQENYALITFGGYLTGENVGQLEVRVGTAPPGDPTFTLDFNRPTIYMALRDRETVDAQFEARATFDGTRDEEALFRLDVRIRRDQNTPEIDTAIPPPWLREPNPRDYTPTTPDQIQSGIAWYVTSAGNGEAKQIVIDHDMDTTDIATVTAIDNATGKPVKFTWAVVTENTIALSFTKPPALNGVRVMVAAAVPVSRWEPHTHTMDQIVGLDETLDDIRGRLNTLEEILPKTGNAAEANGASGVTMLIPPELRVLNYYGELSPQSFGTTPPVDASKLEPKANQLRPAVHNATPIAITNGKEPAAYETGKVWVNNGTAPVELTRKNGGNVQKGEHLASDGRVFYKVRHVPETNSYFPTPFEVELWRIPINEQMLALRRTLDVRFGVGLQLIRANTNAQWMLVIERGDPKSQLDPDPTATNLENVDWEPDPILEQRLIITPNYTSHQCGVRIKRDIDLVSKQDTLTCDTMLYGIWSGANAKVPPNANFVLRACLVNFDIENRAETDARGWLAYALIGTEELEKDGTIKIRPPQAIII